MASIPKQQLDPTAIPRPVQAAVGASCAVQRDAGAGNKKGTAGHSGILSGSESARVRQKTGKGQKDRNGRAVSTQGSNDDGWLQVELYSGGYDHMWI